MKHLGDITKISGYDVPIVDIVTGGSPCQDLSVAGKREGLKGERSGLFMEQIRIIKEMREHDGQLSTDGIIRPRFMVWENVPGAFSSNKGYDFKAVLEETAKIADENAIIPEPTKDKNGKLKWSPSGCIMGDGWSIAWRVHDAQFWGVPQRRKRIALVADFGGETAPEILFERKGLSGNTTKSGKEGQGAAGAVGGSTEKASVYCIQGNCIDRADTAGCNGKGWRENQSYTLNTIDRPAVCAIENHPADSRVKVSEDGIVQTLSSRMGTGGGNVPMVMEPVCVGNGQLAQARISPTVGTLNCMHDQQAVITYGLDLASFNQGMNAQYDFQIDEEKIGTQVAKGLGAVCTEGEQNETTTRNQILRLLQKTYGEKTILKWGTAILERLQQTDILQQGMYESGIQGETENRQELDDSTLPCPSVVAEWLLRDMRQREECGCPSQGWQSSEQRFEQFDEGMPELSQQNSQTCKDLFDMWEKDEGLGLLRQTLSEIQKIWKSIDGQRQSVYGCSIVRRLTPLEAERLQGFPDHWTDIGEWYDSKGKRHKDADSPRYKALGNSIALPFWQYLADKMCAYLNEPTMASLFDGIGGFPLVFTRAGAKPVWASEIEEFPMAVTKRRFPDEVRDDD